MSRGRHAQGDVDGLRPARFDHQFRTGLDDEVLRVQVDGIGPQWNLAAVLHEAGDFVRLPPVRPLRYREELHDIVAMRHRYILTLELQLYAYVETRLCSCRRQDQGESEHDRSEP